MNCFITISSVLDLRLFLRRFLGDIRSLRLLSDFAILILTKSKAFSLFDDFGRIVFERSFFGAPGNSSFVIASSSSMFKFVVEDPSTWTVGIGVALPTDDFLVSSGEDCECGMHLELKTEVSECALGFVKRARRSDQGALPISPFSPIAFPLARNTTEKVTISKF